MKVSWYNYFEDKGVALSTVINKQSTKAQLDFCCFLTSPFEVNTLTLERCQSAEIPGKYLKCVLASRKWNDLISWYDKVTVLVPLSQTNFCVSLWSCSFLHYFTIAGLCRHSADCRATTVALMFSFSMKTCDYVRKKCETKVMLTLRQHRHYFPLSLLPLNVWITRLHFLLMNGEKMQLKKAGSHLGWYIMTSYLSYGLLEHDAR